METTETLTTEAALQIIFQDRLQEGVGETEVVLINNDGLWGFRETIGERAYEFHTWLASKSIKFSGGDIDIIRVEDTL
jgi:hypothetical protein